MMLILLATAQLFLSEIMYNPSGSEHHNEFVEIFNASETDSISLDGFYITDGSGVDKLAYFLGVRKIPPLGYGVIMDRSYHGNSAHYSAELGRGFAVFVPADNSIGSAGLSNSTAETVSLLDTNMNLIDSLTYALGAPNGFSLEHRHHYGGGWRFSLRENGSIGQRNTVDKFIESVLVRSTFSQSEKVLRATFVNTGSESRQFAAHISAEFARFANSQFLAEFSASESHELLVSAGDSLNVSLPIERELSGQYELRTQLRIDTAAVAKDTTKFLALENRFPLWVSYIKLETPQLIELTNKAGFDLRIEEIALRGSGGLKPIKINRDVANGEAIRISKHSREADVFAEDIPYLYTKNGALRLAWMGLADSLKYAVDELAFADFGISLLPSAYAGYNHLSTWEVNAHRDPLNSEKPTAFLLEAEPNPFSPNGDGFEDELRVELNYAEFDLIGLQVYSMYGKKIRTIAPETFRGRGEWIWDGKGKNGEKLNDGVYILLFRGKQKSTGKSITKKFPIVLTN